jgi:hypothetical protein
VVQGLRWRGMNSEESERGACLTDQVSKPRLRNNNQTGDGGQANRIPFPAALQVHSVSLFNGSISESSYVESKSARLDSGQVAN